MSHHPSTSDSTWLKIKSNRERIMTAIPWLWLTFNATWLAVIFITDQPAWPLPIWIATTLGLWSRFCRTSERATGNGR